MANTETYLDTTQAAVYLLGSAHHARTLERWRLEGRTPKYVKLGRMVRYRRSDLDAWAESRARSSTSDGGHGAGSSRS